MSNQDAAAQAEHPIIAVRISGDQDEGERKTAVRGGIGDALPGKIRGRRIGDS